MDRVPLGSVGGVLDEIEYPVSRPEAAEQLQGTTVTFAGGKDDLGGLVSETDADSFESADDLERALHGAIDG
jgi:hypothetical protein